MNKEANQIADFKTTTTVDSTSEISDARNSEKFENSHHSENLIQSSIENSNKNLIVNSNQTSIDNSHQNSIENQNLNENLNENLKENLIENLNRKSTEGSIQNLTHDSNQDFNQNSQNSTSLSKFELPKLIIDYNYDQLKKLSLQKINNLTSRTLTTIDLNKSKSLNNLITNDESLSQSTNIKSNDQSSERTDNDNQNDLIEKLKRGKSNSMLKIDNFKYRKN